MPIALNGSTSGKVTVQAAATAANNTLTLPNGNGMLVGQSTTTAPTNGQIPIGNGTDYTPATITAGTGITVTNGAGSVSIAYTGTAVASTQLAKAWVNFDGTLTSPITPRANYNISSVTKNATGDYTINFTSALTDANYAPVISTCPAGGFGFTNARIFCASGGSAAIAPTTSGFRCNIGVQGSANGVDPVYVSIHVFGN